jgi:hypothetical protein
VGFNTDVSGDRICCDKPDAVDIRGESIRVLGDDGNGRITVLFVDFDGIG